MSYRLRCFCNGSAINTDKLLLKKLLYDGGIKERGAKMDFVRDRQAQSITINGTTYSAEQCRVPEGMTISMLHQTMLEQHGEKSFLVDVAKFLEEWFNSSDLLQVQTSGSTGTPKKLMVEKERMMNSACMTLSFLGLKAGDGALLCMPLAYIAGKMVVVRSLVGRLNLCVTEPSSNPMQAWYEQELSQGKSISEIVVPTFAAMIPMQVYNCVRDPLSDKLLRQVRELIIGGGAVDADLGSRLKDYPHHVWSTYGMTETLSHIALRRINQARVDKSSVSSIDKSNKDALAKTEPSLVNEHASDYEDDGSSWYEPFEGVKLSLSDKGGLVIDAQAVCAQPLITNDVVVFNEHGHFQVIGRLDNVINSGGVKVQIETVEKQLNAVIEDFAKADNQSPLAQMQCMITSKNDEKFGQIVVLLYSFKDSFNHEISDEQWSALFAKLHRYHVPKLKLYVDSLPLTGTGKPDRANAKKIAAS